MMNILETKGHLKKEAGDKAQVYVPVRPQQAVVRSMVREFVDRVFDGSARPLLVHLVKEKGLTDRERRALQKLLDKEGADDALALNLAAYSVQLAVLVGIAAAHGRAVAHYAAGVMLRFWQAVFVSSLLWPAYQLMDGSRMSLVRRLLAAPC